MLLADHEIMRGVYAFQHATSFPIRFNIKPFDKACVQPASYDFHLGNNFRIFSDNFSIPVVDPESLPSYDLLTSPRTVADDEKFVLHPGEFVLGSTREWWEFPDNLAGRVEGCSSLGRLGLLIHSTAGFFDPGFRGVATLELSNVSRLPILLRPGMKIGQMSFVCMSSRVAVPYGAPSLKSHYQDQSGPDPSAGV